MTLLCDKCQRTGALFTNMSQASGSVLAHSRCSMNICELNPQHKQLCGSKVGTRLHGLREGGTGLEAPIPRGKGKGGPGIGPERV